MPTNEKGWFAAPILANKDHSAPSVFKPENLLREARRQKRLATANVPEICILDPDGDIVRALRKSGRAHRMETWACYHTELYGFEHESEQLGIVGCAVGASFAVLLAEELFASGCRLLLSVTSAGQVTESGPLPYFILIDRALRDEGTSYHYLPPTPFATADVLLADRIMTGLEAVDLPVYRGAVWTTDAPFRETAAAIEAAHAAGLLAVEMEAAALYAFAQARGRPVLCFAHVTNQMAVSERDFEKGEEAGSAASLRLLAVAVRTWRASLAGQSNATRSVDASGDVAARPSDQAELFDRLSSLGIPAATVDYPAHRTVAEGRSLRGAMSGCFTKNLLLRDKKGRLFLVVAHEERALDLRTLHRQIGANGRLGFASPDEVRQTLGVEPGALTPLALFLDRQMHITPVIDAALMAEAQLNFHPLVNTRSTGLSPKNLLRFVEACGHRPIVMRLDSEDQDVASGPGQPNIMSLEKNSP